MLTDPIADMLTRLRNANTARMEKVDIPASRIKLEIAKILKEEGFIKGYKVMKDKKQGILRISLKYGAHNERVITNLKRVSKPGCRMYVQRDGLPWVQGGLGLGIVSTSRGVKSDRVCRREGIGGEILCHVW